jgi:hypothetical protein
MKLGLEHIGIFLYEKLSDILKNICRLNTQIHILKEAAFRGQPFLVIHFESFYQSITAPFPLSEE